MYVYKNVAPIYIWSIDFVAEGRRRQLFMYKYMQVPILFDYVAILMITSLLTLF